MSDELIYTRADLPGLGSPNWRSFRKLTETKAVRIEGPFSVATREGVITCEDGWLAVDSGGWPYPIADDEFRRIYEVIPLGEVTA